MSPWSGLAATPRMSAQIRSGASRPTRSPELRGDSSFREERPGHVFVMRGADLLERVRERIVADVVQECRRTDRSRTSAPGAAPSAPRLREQRQRAPGEVIGA